MIVLAGEQLWPNLHGVVHWQELVGLSELCIYFTADSSKSELPARRFAKLIASHYPHGPRIILPGRGLGITPQEVREQIEKWFAEFPHRRWIFNATGGLKLMALGMASFAGHAEFQVVYREQSGNWFELCQPTGSKSIVSAPLEGIMPSETNSVPVHEILKAQFSSTAGEAFTFDSKAVEPLPLMKLTEILLGNQWDWNASFAQLGLCPGIKPGILFEKYLGACLLEFGVSNSIHSFKVLSQGVDKNEIDLISNVDGQVVILDLKLRDEADIKAGKEEKLTSQMRQASEIRRRLGGLAAKMIMVRPGLVFSESDNLLAGAYQIERIDQRDCFNLFTRLAKAFRRELPSELQKIEQLLAQSQQNGATSVFSREHPVIVEQLEQGKNPLVYNMLARLEELMRQRCQDWVLYSLDTLWLRCLRKPDENQLQSLRSRHPRVEIIKMLNSFELNFPMEYKSALMEGLKPFLNKGLDLEAVISNIIPSPVPTERRSDGLGVGDSKELDMMGELEKAMDQASEKRKHRPGAGK